MQFHKRTRAALCCFAFTPLVLFTGIGRDAILSRIAPGKPALLHEVSLPETSLDDFSLRNTLFDAPAATDIARSSAQKTEQQAAPAVPSAHVSAALTDIPAAHDALPARSSAPAPSPLPAATTARFFTINEVLAKRAAQSANGQAAPVKLAAIEQPTLNDAAIAPSPSSHANEPFGLALFRAPEGSLWRKWRAVQHEMASDAATIEQCRASGCYSGAARRFLSLTEAARAIDGRARLAEVNRSVNQAIRYTSDLAQHGTPDLWSTPLATLGSGRGDCEDYAILKYAILRDAGTAPADMKIVLLRDNLRREDHAVLAVMSGGEWMVLDNHLRIPVAARELTHYAARYALTENGVGLFASPYAEHSGRDVSQEIPSMEAALASRDTARLALRPSF